MARQKTCVIPARIEMTVDCHCPPLEGGLVSKTILFENVTDAKAIYEVSRTGRICDPSFYDITFNHGRANYSIPAGDCLEVECEPVNARFRAVDMKGAPL